jgi:hypothetical protein
LGLGEALGRQPGRKEREGDQESGERKAAHRRSDVGAWRGDGLR